MNLINGCRIILPNLLLGIIIYITHSTGKNIEMRVIINNFTIKFLLRNPGKSWYHKLTNNC